MKDSLSDANHLSGEEAAQWARGIHLMNNSDRDCEVTIRSEERGFLDVSIFLTDQVITIPGLPHQVPKGFGTYGATIPPQLSLIGVLLAIPGYLLHIDALFSFGMLLCIVPLFFPRISNYFKPAAWHDYVIRNNLMSRYKADIYFRKALKIYGVRWYRRFPMYVTVTIYSFFFNTVKMILGRNKAKS